MQNVALLQSGALKGATSLKLAEGLTSFPEAIFDLADTLEVLDLSGNRLTSLPADFGRLRHLRILFCSDNLFTTLPEVLGNCPKLEIVGFKANQITDVPPQAIQPNLRWLILTNNRITVLPDTIGDCARMEKLALAGNQLTSLPDALSQCQQLALLRISANQLTTLPHWLLSLPRLAWLAFSGNPLCIRRPPVHLPPVAWQQLELQEVLGQGASGVIYKAHWLPQKKTVALKVFKGAVTSDGLPEDERDTFIAAGAHPGLVTLFGQLDGHPEGTTGLVMELIDPKFYNLGQPPSLASCSRDVMSHSKPITTQKAVNIAATIASVAAQLHKRGISHGDLYAHNTLVDDEGNTLFGDFGAATFYDRANTSLAAALERLEVCAFGHLIDDLLQICVPDNNHHTRHNLTRLRDAATQPNVLSRPDFAQLHEELMELMER